MHANSSWTAVEIVACLQHVKGTERSPVFLKEKTEKRDRLDLEVIPKVTSLVSPCISIAPAMVDRYLAA